MRIADSSVWTNNELFILRIPFGLYALLANWARRALFSVVPGPRIPEKTLYHRRSSRTRLVTQWLGCLWMQQMAWFKERNLTLTLGGGICNSFLCHKPWIYQVFSRVILPIALPVSQHSWARPTSSKENLCLCNNGLIFDCSTKSLILVKISPWLSLQVLRRIGKSINTTCKLRLFVCTGVRSCSERAAMDTTVPCS